MAMLDRVHVMILVSMCVIVMWDPAMLNYAQLVMVYGQWIVRITVRTVIPQLPMNHHHRQRRRNRQHQQWQPKVILLQIATSTTFLHHHQQQHKHHRKTKKILR